VVIPWLEGRKLVRFRELAAELDALTEPAEITRTLPAPPQPERGEGVSRRELITAPARLFQAEPEGEKTPTERVTVQRPLHTALRYGVSQALLQAVALVRGMTPAELIAEEWVLPGVAGPLRLYVESGGDHHRNAERMILRHLDSLGHSLGEDASTGTSDLPPLELGSEGAALSRYIRWLAQRVRELGSADYRPTLHLDLHGALGRICENNAGRMLGQLYAWQLAAGPYTLRLESPMLHEGRADQIAAMKTLREYRQFRKMTVELVADEWANTLEDVCAFLEAGAADMIHVTMPDLGGIHNTVEAVLACKAAGVAVLLGGSQVETDLSARASLHVALATQPDMVMAKPGLDVDAAISLAQNEAARTLSEIQLRPQE
jgi:methylaspartate ammonia-lyase